MNIRRRPSRQPTPGTPALEQLEQLADDAIDLAQQIRATVAELRRQDTRGDSSDG